MKATVDDLVTVAKDFSAGFSVNEMTRALARSLKVRISITTVRVLVREAVRARRVAESGRRENPEAGRRDERVYQLVNNEALLALRALEKRVEGLAKALGGRAAVYSSGSGVVLDVEAAQALVDKLNRG